VLEQRQKELREQSCSDTLLSWQRGNLPVLLQLVEVAAAAAQGTGVVQSGMNQVQLQKVVFELLKVRHD
jgi:hypothetical protein